MRRQTQNMLAHLLPIVFWLLAVVGSLVPIVLIVALDYPLPLTLYLWSILVAVLALIVIHMMARIQRHTSSEIECLWMGLLLGIASYWLPSVLFLVPAVWFYLIYQNLFSFRSFMATLIGLSVVAIWMAVLYACHLLPATFDFFANLFGWIPTGSFVIAYLASTIAQRNLRVR